MSPCISFGIWRQCFPEFLLRRARARRKSPRILLDPYWVYHLVPTIRQSKIAKDKSTVQRDMVPLKTNIFRSSLLVYRKIIQIYQEKSSHLSKLRFPCLDVWNKKKDTAQPLPMVNHVIARFVSAMEMAVDLHWHFQGSQWRPIFWPPNNSCKNHV